MSVRKARMIRAFDRAHAYDEHAHIQAETADRLATRIAGLNIDTALPALEIGCGTGFLTERLLRDRPSLPLTVSDVAPAMVDRARQRLSDRPNVSFAVIDGEDPGTAPEGGWGLIASSLAFQWFEQPRQSITRLTEQLASGGYLAFTTLAAGSFVEWQSALSACGLDNVLRRWPEENEIADFCPTGAEASIESYTLVERHSSARDFLRSLKAIGAETPWNGRVSAGDLRRAMRAFERAGSAISYRIAEVVIRKGKAPEGL